VDHLFLLVLDFAQNGCSLGFRHLAVELLILNEFLNLGGLLVQVGDVFLQLFAPLFPAFILILLRLGQEFLHNGGEAVDHVPVILVDFDVLLLGQVFYQLDVDVFTELIVPLVLQLLEEALEYALVAHTLARL